MHTTRNGFVQCLYNKCSNKVAASSTRFITSHALTNGHSTRIGLVSYGRQPSTEHIVGPTGFRGSWMQHRSAHYLRNGTILNCGWYSDRRTIQDGNHRRSWNDAAEKSAAIYNSVIHSQVRTYMWRSYYFPFAAHLDEDEYFMPPPSERTMYTNRFDQSSDPKLFKLEDQLTPFHADLHPTDDPSQFCVPVIDPHRFDYAHAVPELYYYQFFEHTFPRQPDLSKGELAVGASSSRTSVWHTPGEPAITSIARFEPRNFRPAGYAENNLQVTHSPPDCYPQIPEGRLAPGHADRRAIVYFAQLGVLSWHALLVRNFVYWILQQYMTMEPGMQWPKPVEIKYSSVSPGQQLVVNAGGTCAFVRHRTEEEIRQARTDDQIAKTFRDPELDSDRCPDPEWLLCSSSCTHLGCTPFRGGNYGGFLCPCHGSHYDSSGRIRFGPAPKNLPKIHSEVLDEETLLVGSAAPTERRWV